MLGRDYADQVCSLSRSLEVVGERWTLLILRDVLLGRCRFDELIDSTGVTRTVLTQRLAHLVNEGVLERVPYQERPARFEYRLTGKGQALTPVIAHLIWWGDQFYPEAGGAPRLLVHRSCGGPVGDRFTCRSCSQDLDPADVTTAPGPGAAAPADR